MNYTVTNENYIKFYFDLFRTNPGSRLRHEGQRSSRRPGSPCAGFLFHCYSRASSWVADTETCGLSPEDEDALAKAADAIAEADAAGIIPADVHAFLAERRQIAVIWSVEDVQEIRPDLTDEQAWDVLEHAERHHDATIGINWDVLTATPICSSATPQKPTTAEEE